MGSNYTILIRFSLGIILIILGANQFFNFIDFSSTLAALEANKSFYGILFILSGISILTRKAMPIVLIILSYFAVQAFFYFLSNNPKNLISPIGVVVLLIVLNILDNKNRFKGLFH